MATAEEILKKANNRKDQVTNFNPKKRRAWDFIFEKKELKQENGLKHRNKIGTIREQNRNKIKTIREQNKNNKGTKLEQNRNKTRNTTGNKKEIPYLKKPQKHFNHETKISDQLQNNYDTTTDVLCVMNGIQNKIMRQVISHIKNQPNKNYSVDIPIDVLAKKINASKESIRVSIKRLRKKNLLIRLRGEKGRYGNTKVNVPDNVVKKYFELFNDPPCNINKNNIGTILEQNTNKYRNINGNNQDYSSSYNYKTTTIDTDDVKKSSQLQLPIEWQNIDIEPLSKTGFTIAHLFQIASQNKLSPQVAQDSIYAFAFDLQENNKAKNINGDPINYFMGILRKGKPYAPTSNYESPQDKAMRLYKERMNEIEQRKIVVEKEAINLAFNDWFAQLNDDQKRELLPKVMRRSAKLENNKILESSARGHFEKEIWPDKKMKIIGNTGAIEHGGEKNNNTE